MQRKWFLVPIGAVSVMLLAGYGLFSMSARRPLSLSKSFIFSSVLLPATPSSILDKENWSAAFELARHTFTAPISTDSLAVAGQRYEVPLPTHSFRDSKCDPYPTPSKKADAPCVATASLTPTGNRNGFVNRDSSGLHTYITFATGEQLDAYYSNTLPEAGWEYFDRMGGTRVYRKNTARLVISDSFYRETRINQLGLIVNEVNSTKH
jgi:hypothetical protein